MTKGRMEAFSDGVIAIIITIMVLEMKVPHGHDLASLRPLLPVFLSYILSYVHIGIYWNNHHHMLQRATHVGGWVLWANLHLLFWLSLMPFATGFMGENRFAKIPVALYLVDLLACAIAYFLLEQSLVARHGRQSDFAQALRKSWKDKYSPAIYLAGLGLTFVSSWLGLLGVITVAAIWFIPDRRFERR
jgi:uncharacterized membrane protein